MDMIMTYIIANMLSRLNFRLMTAGVLALSCSDAFSSQPVKLSYNVTQGSRFEIDASRVPGVKSFTSAPEVFVRAVVVRESGQKTVEYGIKKYAKLLTSEYPTDKIQCEWFARTEPGTYTLFISFDRSRDEKPRTLKVTDSFNVMPPSITSLAPTHGLPETPVTVTGKYFGSRKPELWLDCMSGGDAVRFNCPVSANKMLEDGISELNFAVPSSVPPGANCKLHLRNIIAETVVDFLCGNQPPTAVGDKASTAVSTPVQIDVLANDSDPDGDKMILVSATKPSCGDAVVSGPKTVKYIPRKLFEGGDTFQYTVRDAAGASSAATVEVSVKGVNTAPVARDDVAVASSGSAKDIAVLANDTDPDGDPLQVLTIWQPSAGTAVKSADSLKVLYTPPAGFTGAASFKYVITDGRGGTSIAQVNVAVSGSSSNHPPNASDDSATTTRNMTVEIPVLANDGDADGDPLSVAGAGSPSHGNTLAGSGSITYMPAKDYIGPDSFTYIVSDNKGGSSIGTVNITVLDNNTAPAALDDSISTGVDQAVEVWVLSNDRDLEGDTLGITAAGPASHGTVSISSAGTTIIYTPEGSYAGTDSFSYSISDGKGGTDAAVVTVIVSSTVDGIYLTVDISGGPKAASYAYQFLNSPPADLLTNDTYKTGTIVLRKIAAGTFTMGSPEAELARLPNESQHNVTLSNSYFVGVFEVTQAQYANVMGEDPSLYKGGLRPVENVSWEKVRGGTWPGGSAAAGSFAGKLSAKTGLAFDLPTEAEWEYACRAGTTLALNNNQDIMTPAFCPFLDMLGWYYYNSYQEKHRDVGQKLPNAWGLYDMHGNVWELCLDWFGEYSGGETDPAGPALGSARIIRGGSWSYYSRSCRSAARNYVPQAGAFDNLGFRISAK